MDERLKTVFCSKCGTRQTIEAWRTDFYCVNCGNKVLLESLRLQHFQNSGVLPTKIQIPISYAEIKKLSCSEAVKYFQSLGFQNIRTEGVRGSARQEGNILEVYVNGLCLLFSWKKTFSQNSMILIKYYYHPSRKSIAETAGQVVGKVASSAWETFWDNIF